MIRSKISGEGIAVFATTEVRDAVRRSAKNLAGAPDSGIRLEIPTALQSSLKALEAVSYELKQKHSGIKRSIKFDDDQMDLVLDFNVKPDDGGDWKRVTAVQAKVMTGKLRKGAGKAAEMSDTELESLIGSGT